MRAAAVEAKIMADPCASLRHADTGASILVTFEESQIGRGAGQGYRYGEVAMIGTRLEHETREARAEVDADAIFINSGKFWTSAGMLAGIDMALAMIETDHGRQLALQIARFLVLPQRRSGGQSQFSAHLSAKFSDDARVRHVQRHILENPQRPLSISLLKRMAGMSERSLRRHFKERTGRNVFRYVEDVRLALACDLLERTQHPVDTVATRSGFGTATTLRRVFARRLGVTPSVYRDAPDRDRLPR